ncbi:stage III sporulation protein SpoIIIAB [Paenibacillus arenosi]|uniref:Stage III sporulation protein AB n=1 Tax=Paenibacillus arenosi TaxID=2774142 RepID=A0ABR9AUE0_9BACL|nr:stage III sporulation protein SpoIIIAB [Paenibacillus arenosi]MBD8497743.1 stage III sporulation protein AB [Paenibacillus arenosi]
MTRSSELFKQLHPTVLEGRGKLIIKLLGAAIVIAAAGAIGWIQASHYAARPRQLRQLIIALQRLETSVMYGHTPLDEACEQLSAQVPPPLNKLFAQASAGMRARDGHIQTAKAAWHAALQSEAPHSALKSQDVRILYDLGMSLGISDREDQRNHIRHAMKRLEQEEANASDEAGRYVRMYRSIGVLSGILAVILMY